MSLYVWQVSLGASAFARTWSRPLSVLVPSHSICIVMLGGPLIAGSVLQPFALAFSGSLVTGLLQRASPTMVE